MKTRQLGDLWPVSALTLGGGGVGQLWGETTREECVGTVRAAVDAGVTLLDMAPRYGDGEAELVIGEAFDGKLPDGVRVTTKHRLGTPPSGEVEENLIGSLEESLERMRLERVDLFFLHSNIIPDDYDASAYVDRPATRWTTYIEQFVPTCEKLKADGRIGAWGITGIGIPDCILQALGETARPAAVQCITNLLDSPGELQYFPGPSRARELIAATKASGSGYSVFGPFKEAHFVTGSTGNCRTGTAWWSISPNPRTFVPWPRNWARAPRPRAPICAVDGRRRHRRSRVQEPGRAR